MPPCDPALQLAQLDDAFKAMVRGEPRLGAGGARPASHFQRCGRGRAWSRGMADRRAHGRGWTRRALARAGLALPVAALAGDPGPSAAAGRPWHHLPGGGFRNPPDSPERAGGGPDWWAFLYRRLVARQTVPELPPGHLLGPRRTADGIQALNGGDHVTWLGHACFLLRLGGTTLLTDPFLGEHASPVPPLGPRRFAPVPLAIEQLPPVDIVLLSHNHYDHLDLPSLARIGQRWRPSLVTTLGVSAYLDRAWFRDCHELDWYQPIERQGLRIVATPAIHFSKRTPFDTNRSLWCGFRIETPGRALHFTGDTAHGPVFEEILARLGPVDLALVPIGSYAPRALMLGTHCTPEEAVAIGRMLGAQKLCGMHWGTIRLTDEPPFEPPARFHAAADAGGYGAARAWTPAIGETRAI
jgi:L-ascorbate metabolism protein UlaG (beta-lactamase superfamily)